MRVQKAIWILNLVLVLAAGFLLSEFLRGRLRTEEEPPPREEAKAPSVPPDATRPERDQGPALPSRDLFDSGAPEEPKEEPEPRPEPPPQPDLRLRLIGTIAGSPDMARAVIDDLRERSQNMYRVGDIVQGAKIVRIERSRVVLDLDGREAVLTIDMTASRSAPARSPEFRDAGPAHRPDGVLEEVAQGEFAVDIHAFESSGGVASLLRSAALSPHTVDGETIGLRVDDLEAGSLAQLAGIRNGDIIQRVNGQHLSSLPKAFQVMRKARVQSSLNLQLLREGEEKSLSFAVKQP